MEKHDREKDQKYKPGAGNDLAEDNLMNDWDMTRADLQDFWRKW